MPSDHNWISYQGVTYALKPGERALDALLRGGAPVPFSCRKGSCRSCMMQAVSGDPGDNARKHLPAEMQAAGLFLPCSADDPCEVEAREPDLTQFTIPAMVAEKIMLAPDILRLKLEPEREVTWQAGQVISLINPDGESRSYSLVSLPSDYYLTVDIRVYQGGRVSAWLADQVKTGEMVGFRGPSGNFVYDAENLDQPLLLLASGTGGGAVLGIARAALESGHVGPIHFYHGGRTRADLYLAQDIAALSAPNLVVRQIASRETAGDEPAARLTDVAFADLPDLTGFAVYLCGAPDLVETARIAAVAAGAALDQIRVDPFDPPEPYAPRDGEKLRGLKPDPEVWNALRNGKLLIEVLEDFYTQVYADPRLEPFFHRVTKSRAVEKQYSFLRDIFAGTKENFGEKPFNAHHWMVISDELFDYREALFFETVRAHGFPEPLIPRWAALHETFRREIVKSAARGQIRKGVEHFLEGYQEEIVAVGTVCDACGSEIHEGDSVRMHRRTGEIFCITCATPHMQTTAA